MNTQSPTSQRERLLTLIAEREKGLDPRAWVASLDERKREEADFHDWSRDPELAAKEAEYEASHGNKKFYDTSQASFDHAREWIQRNARGQIVLDFACGDGGNSFVAAEAGAELVIGIDISPTSIENCRREAARRKLDNVRFIVADCEATGLPDASIDRVIAMGCLHHLDLTYAFPELRRILKPGGRLFALEALDYNPVIKMYRRRTPELRTAWEKEHILSLKELRFARNFFEVENVRYFHLASVLSTPLRRTRAFGKALRVANAIDRVILRIPPISYLAWMFSFELVKPQRQG